MQRQRKILLAVAGVAGLLVAADRVLLGGAGATGGPQAANASVASSVQAPTSDALALPVTPTPPVAAVRDPPADTASLAQRLQEVRGTLSTTTPDAFSASGHWDRPVATPTPTAPTSPSFDPRAFARRYPLHAVYAEAGQRRAMIDGRAMQVGDQREGVTLTAIDDRAVEWSGHGVRFRITLDRRR